MSNRNSRSIVKLKDISKKTGYSINTVSHALRDKDDVQKETKELIKKVAEEMGYVENAIARSMRVGYTKTIAVILGDISNPHFAIVLKEIEIHANKEGYTVILLNTNEDEYREFEAIKTALHRSVDGIIICPVQKTIKNIEYLKSTNIPFVLIGRYFNNLDTSYSVCNDVQGGYLATKYLIEHGHKKILMLCGEDYISSARERLAGYKKALVNYGLEYNPDLVKRVGITGRNLHSILSTVPLGSYSAIFAFSDLIGWDAWSYLVSRGVQVPEDVSIIGFDHIQSRLSFPFKLTSVSIYKAQMSLCALQILLKRINGSIEEEHSVIDTTIAEGESVAYKL